MSFWTKKKIDVAEVYAKGEEFYGEKNYDKAVECYKTAAKHGHADAMFSLGRMYEEGTGVELDYIRAVSYYEKAVRLGSIDSMVMLGNCYVSGTGVSIDYDRAIEIWSIAAERGSKEAQHNIEWIRYCNNEELNLAMSLIYGTDGAVQNVPDGLGIVNKGIRLRDPAAIHLMGQLLIEGVSGYIEKDISAGLSNIIDAARQGEVIALYDLISIHQEGHLHGAPVTISDAFFGQNIVAIAEVIDSHEYGINWAYAWAAWAYAHGKGVTKSKNLAKKWINRLPIEMREGPFIKSLPL